jgi:hypothetical protein
MLFNDLLAKENIDPNGVLVLRHTPSERDGDLKEVLPWLAAEHPVTFNAYQSTQNVRVEAHMLKAKYVASFIGLEKNAAVFVGLYKVGDHRPLTYEQFWAEPAYQKLKEYGSFVEGERDSVLWFDLTITDFYKRWQGKLVIEWPPPPRQWWRWANKAKFPIHAILEDSSLIEAMPDWKECILSWAKLSMLPNKWRERLSQWRGIYCIFDHSDGKAYVGAAYGKDNIRHRWEHYEESGHGGNVLLRKRSPENFSFSILERVSPDMEPDDVRELERTWKDRLHTRSPLGLNDN